MLSELMSTTCPHCNASIEIVYVPADGEQEYIEDCEVCCQPFTVSVYNGGVTLDRDT